MTQPELFARLLSIAIVIHQLMGFAQSGSMYFRFTFLPTFGLQLRRYQQILLHFSLMFVAFAIAMRPSAWALYPVLWICLTAVLASYPFRLSNHLIVAWFFLALLCFDLCFVAPESRGQLSSEVLCTGGRMVIISTYFLAFFHKLNADFFNIQISCASGFALLYARNRGLAHPLFVWLLTRGAIFGTVALELTIPALLLVPGCQQIGLVLALLMHMAFGFLCHVHFSCVMLAGLSLYLSLDSASIELSDIGVMLTMALAGAACGARLGVYSIFRYARLMRAIQMIFGSYIYLAVCVVANCNGFNTYTLPQGDGAIVLASVVLLFLANGLSPYFGLKTEFSMAMFSNLRPDRFVHFIAPSWWSEHGWQCGEYVTVNEIRGLPSIQNSDETGVFIMSYLSKPQKYKYSSRFMHYALCYLSSFQDLNHQIEIIYEDGSTEVFDSDHLSKTGSGFISKNLTLFPPILPREFANPHCG